MINTIYANYAGYIWMLGLCAITFFMMMALKKSFTKLTNLLYEKKVFSDREKVVVNLVLGLAFSIAVAFAFGKFGSYLFGQKIEYKWFVFAGILSTGIYLTVEKVKLSSVVAVGNALIESMKASNIEVTEKDAPEIARKLCENAKAFESSNSNTHNNVLDNISNGIGNVFEISKDDIAKLEQNVAELKRRGFDTSKIEQGLAQARNDGSVTKDEYDHLIADLKVLLQRYRA